MILAFDILKVSINLLLVIFIVVSLVMVLIILMQRPKQEGLGAAFGSGTTDQLFGARTTNVLQKGTVYLGVTFFILTLVLAILIARRNKVESLVNDEPAAQEQAADPATEPDKGEEATPAEEKKPADGAEKPADGAPEPGDAKPDGAEKPANLKPVPAPVPPPAEPEVGTPPEAPAEPAEAPEETGDEGEASEGAAMGALLGAMTGDADEPAEEEPAEEKPAEAEESGDTETP